MKWFWNPVGLAIILLGVITFWLPVPIGLPLLAVGSLILLRHSRQFRDLVAWASRRHPKMRTLLRNFRAARHRTPD